MKKNIIQIILAALYVIVGLIVCINSLSGSMNSLLYYTFQGNVLCIIIMAIDLGFLLAKKPLPSAISILEFCGMMTIITIGIVFCTLLSDITSKTFWADTQSLFFHFINPIWFTAYIFIFRKKQMPSLRKVFWCTIPPLAYIAFVYIRNAVLGIRWFPYFFVDLDKIGITGVLQWSLIICASLLSIGTILLLLCKKSKKRFTLKSL